MAKRLYEASGFETIEEIHNSTSGDLSVMKRAPNPSDSSSL